MDIDRIDWNGKHKALRKALNQPDQLDTAKQLFMDLHAPLHTSEVASSVETTLEDELWKGLTEAEFRCVPPGEEHSIAWCLWHLARIEDAAMNVVVADFPQVFSGEGWEERLHAPMRDTANNISPEGVQLLSEKVAFMELREYRSTVGKSTREVVSGLVSADIRRKAPAERLQRLLDEGAVLPKSQGVLDYWGGLTVAGLLLMPPTRHNLIHIREALSLKRKARKYLKS